MPVHMSRRQFLTLAGAAGAVAVPALLGYTALKKRSADPAKVSPYASTVDRELSAATCPLMILTNERGDNPFGPYLAEILRLEGLNCFQTVSLSAVDLGTLKGAGLVLLAEGPLNQAEIELLQTYVAQGGRLVTMRPDVGLASLLGLERVSGTSEGGYVQVDVGHPAALGATAESLQFHGVADRYRPAGAQVVAWLSEDGSAPTAFPAVTVHRYEQGWAALWAFDLARDVAYTRQGNIAWTNQERDGKEGIRAHDAFIGWMDLDRIEIPQADEQARLFSRVVSYLLADRLPLPRLWYFGGAADTMLVITGDSHANPAFAIRDVLGRVEQYGGHMSIYYAPQETSGARRALRKLRWWAGELPLIGDLIANPTGFPSPSDVAEWRSRGHEFGLHPYVEEGIESGILGQWKEFDRLGYDPIPPTVRTHRVLWKGWVETAKVQASLGFRMNLDYYHIGPAFKNKAGEWRFGHFTGSGLPMRFVDEQGEILNIYQQLTQLADEHLFRVPWGAHVDLSPEEAIEVSQELLRRSLESTFSAIVVNAHVDPYAMGGDYAERAGHWLEGLLDYAATLHIPIWSAHEWLRFTEVRHDAELEQVQWDSGAGRLSCHLAARTAPGVELAVMFPLEWGASTLDRVQVGGTTVVHRQRRLGGVEYGWVSVEAGAHDIVAMYG
jgi:hypothetical protein